MCCQVTFDDSHGWLRSRIVYDGHATAHFSDREGQVTGSGSAAFEQSGHSDISMAMTDLQAPASYPHGLLQFLGGGQVDQAGRFTMPIFATNPNRCERVEITTPEGTLRLRGPVLYDVPIFVLWNERMGLHPLRSEFEATAVGTARFWVVPLVNFVCNMSRSDDQIAGHPLSILTAGVGTAADPQVAPQDRPGVIRFEYGGAPAFIETLPDYPARVEALRAGRAARLVTCIMVGETGADTLTLEGPHSWFIHDLLGLLSVLTGAHVGAPWIEVRDDTGALMRRLHVHIGSDAFSKGHAFLDNFMHGGFGPLLTSAPRSAAWATRCLRNAMLHAVEAGDSNRHSIDDMVAHAVRGLDALCVGFGFRTQNLLEELPPDLQDAVRDVLREARERLDIVAQRLADGGRSYEGGRVATVAQRTAQTPAGKTSKFGLAVADLLRAFDLHDADVAERYYQSQTRARSWQEVISIYRGATLHEGGFELGDAERVADAAAVWRHLHDILGRLILKMLGYSGTYQPTMVSMTARYPVDWVEPTTPADRLGYR